MQDLEAILRRIEEQKKERKKIKAGLTDILQQSKAWTDARDEQQVVKAKIGQIQISLLQPYQSELDQLDRIKLSIDVDQMMVNDMVYTMILKGKPPSIVDAEGTIHMPQIKVSYGQLRLL